MNNKDCKDLGSKQIYEILRIKMFIYHFTNKG